MAGADFAASGGKGKGRRISIYIDMTPMVDVIILLLIFFFMTSQFKEPMGVEISLPSSKGAESQVKVKESNTIIIRVDAQGEIFIVDKARSGAREVPAADLGMALNKYLSARQQENKDLITILDISPDAPYSRMVDVLDEFKLASDVTKNTKISLTLGEEPPGTAATAAAPPGG